MLWLLTRPVVWPAKVGAFSAVAGYRTGRLVGYRRLAMLGVGVLIGLAVAPVPGRELRDRVFRRLSASDPLALPPAGDDAADADHPPSPS